jgi:hypothetical protein
VYFTFLAAGLAVGLDACSMNTEPTSPGNNGGAAAAGGTGGTAGMAPVSFEIGLSVLTPDGTALDAMNLSPSAVLDVVAHTNPASAHTLRFALLGTPLDAVLGATETTTDAHTGDAHVVLIAPSNPATFSVRATATGAAPAIVDLAVPKTSMAELEIYPSYAGERVVKSYVASATENMTCADLQGSPPSDGPITVSAIAFPIPLLVPADTKLAVTLRAANFAWGCTTVNTATEGVENDVEVVMTNVPMKLDKSDVDFTLTLDTLDEFQAALAGPEQTIALSVLGEHDDDVDALLSQMAANASNGDSFSAARTTLGWDDAVRSTLGAASTDALRAPLARWMQAGIDANSLDNRLQGSLQGVADAAPTLTLSSIFGISTAHASAEPSGTQSWEAGADDGVLIGMRFSFLPAWFLLSAARGPAVHEVSGATSLSEALAGAVSCADVATTLVAHGKSKGHSTSDCDKNCTRQLCDDAVHALLVAALASDPEPSTFEVALTASGSVGDDAELTGFSGNWLGHWSLPDGTTDLHGTASGAAAPSP